VNQVDGMCSFIFLVIRSTNWNHNGKKKEWVEGEGPVEAREGMRVTKKVSERQSHERLSEPGSLSCPFPSKLYGGGKDSKLRGCRLQG